jgi:glucan 1,3-beta-glucosidase
MFYKGLSHLTISSGSGNPSATGIHWAQSQACQLRNVTIDMSGGGKAGLFGENGSGGFIDGLTIIGGTVPFDFGNQQYAINNLHIIGAPGTTTMCSNLFWSWTLTFTNLRMENCPIGFVFKGGQAGALVLVDATMVNVPLGISTDYVAGQPWSTAATLYLERFTGINVSQVTQGLPGAAGGTVTLASWAQGPTYRKGALATEGQSTLPPVLTSPLVLPPRPTLAELTSADIVNVLDHGAVGNGIADDTAALQAAIAAQPPGGAVFLPQGAYLLTGTLTLRPDSTLIGEALSELRASPSAALWADAALPAPLVQLPPTPPGSSPQGPRLLDLLLATSGSGDVPGCVMLDWQSSGAALWDVHHRVYDVAHTLTHLHGAGAGGSWSSGWQWVADHDITSGASLAVRNPRGMLVEGSQGPLLLYAVAAEHSLLYQFNFTASANVVQVTLQIETAYFLQPQSGWGLSIERAAGSHVLYGGGAYSWGEQFGHGKAQTIVQVVDSPAVALYSLNTVGSVMLLVGDATITANTTQDQARFAATATAVLNV